jgi:BirA family biotin operon repressor/biotin-[acetyl-CoA-carboxylase] ligase
VEGLLNATLANDGGSVVYGTPLYACEVVDSTLDVARKLAMDGAPDGTLVTAQHQLAGRGRRRVQWFDEPGESALLTYILRPVLEKILVEPWRIPFLGSLACVLAAQDLGLADAKVKWPNDIYSGGRKLGGMIVDTVDRQASTACYLLGIGINVLQTSFTKEETFIQPATSFARELEAGESDNRVPTVAAVTDRVSARLSDVMNEFAANPSELMSSWRQHQMTGHTQNGISLDGTRQVHGEYVDVRESDGAGLIKLDANLGPIVAILPGR